VKYGLWENGKRLKWFDEQSIMLINQHTFDYTTLFTEQQSITLVQPKANFTVPPEFELGLATIKRVLNVPLNY